MLAIYAKLNEWLASCATWADQHPRPAIIKRNTPTTWRTGWEIGRLHRCGVRADRIIETAVSVVLWFGDPPASQKWRRFTIARHVLNLATHFVSDGGNSIRLSSAVLDQLGSYLLQLLNPMVARLSVERS